MFGALLAAGACQAEPLLSASTELASPAERPATAAIARAIVAGVDKDDAESLKECMVDLHIRPGAYEKLFRTVALPELVTGEELYFVRPAHKPYCFTFYGAHLFRYWLLSVKTEPQGKAYKIRFVGVGDEFQVLRSASHGNYDIAETNCTASSCFTVTLRHDGVKYVPLRCSERRFAGDGKDIETPVACAN
jgi:hypothetical protein